MHLGRSNCGRIYTVDLISIDVDRDLFVVHVHSSLKVVTRIDKVVKKIFAMFTLVGEQPLPIDSDEYRE